MSRIEKTMLHVLALESKYLRESNRNYLKLERDTSTTIRFLFLAIQVWICKFW